MRVYGRAEWSWELNSFGTVCKEMPVLPPSLSQQVWFVWLSCHPFPFSQAGAFLVAFLYGFISWFLSTPDLLKNRTSCWPLGPFVEKLNSHSLPNSLYTPPFLIRPCRKKQRYGRRVQLSKLMKLKAACNFWMVWQSFKLSLLQIKSSNFLLVADYMHEFVWSSC